MVPARTLCAAMLAGAAIAILFADRPAGADCVDGKEEGYEQCKQHPGCLCDYVVHTCKGGGWYFEYLLTGSGACGGPHTGSSAPTSEGSNSKDQHCRMMRKWLDQNEKFLRGYEDDDLLKRAISHHWSPVQYNTAVDRAANPPTSSSTSGSGGNTSSDNLALMGTNPKTCKIDHEDTGCQWLLQHGLPQDACTIAKDHEEVHVRQCKHGRLDPSDLRERRRREVEAYRRTISEIQHWLGAHCGP